MVSTFPPPQIQGQGIQTNPKALTYPKVQNSTQPAPRATIQARAPPSGNVTSGGLAMAADSAPPSFELSRTDDMILIQTLCKRRSAMRNTNTKGYFISILCRKTWDLYYHGDARPSSASVRSRGLTPRYSPGLRSSVVVTENTETSVCAASISRRCS